MRQSAWLVFNPVTVNKFASLFNCTPVGRASDSRMGPIQSCLFLLVWAGAFLSVVWPRWYSSNPVFQWNCSTPQGSPGVGRNTFLSCPHLCFMIVFICDLFVSRDDPLMS